MNEIPLHRTAPTPLTLRALVVDDREDVADTLAMLLQRSGYTVQVAYTGKEALEKGGLLRPDVVFLDIGLPDRSGHDVCKDMRNSDWGATAFIVALTGHNEPSDMIRSAHNGFDRHVGKPMEFETMQEILRTAKSRAA